MKSSSLKLLSAVLLAALSEGATLQVAQAQSGRDGIIRDALQRGAHVVQCQNNECQDQTTMESLDHNGKAPDGVYLVYPNTTNDAADIARTRDDVKAIR